MAAEQHPKVVQGTPGPRQHPAHLDTCGQVVPGMQERASERLDALLTPKAKTAKA